MENSVLNKMWAAPLLTFKGIQKMMPETPTFLDKPVWQGGEFKAGTSKQL